jgi:alcohol dehydrogenase, propanol-preferring
VVSVGPDVVKFNVGDLAGATWEYGSCGHCKFCNDNLENLCAEFRGTGCHANGGYASYMVIAEDYAVRMPPELADPVKAAPLMCAGVTGYRSLKLSEMEDGKTLGLYGFGSAHHLLLQTANYAFPHSKKFVMARNPSERALAMNLGADWVGDIDDRTPLRLDCSIDTTPAWKPVLCALDNLERGGRLVINVIRKEVADQDTLVALDYARHLWMEKDIKTVANVTRTDAEEFLALAARARIRPEVQEYKLESANEALVDLKSGKIHGSKVLIM